MFSIMRMDECIKSELSGVVPVKLVVKNIVLGCTREPNAELSLPCDVSF